MRNEERIDSIATKIKSMFSSKEVVTFLLIGRTGVGKSSTINSLLGQEVAPIGKYQPTTISVSTYTHHHDGLSYNIVDTPGLCDDLPEAGNDIAYLSEIAKMAKDADCIWFVSELDATRVTSDEKRGIKLITQSLGEQVWSRSIIVFTRADKSTSFEEDMEQRTKIVRMEIEKHYSDAMTIPAVAVSNVSTTLPNGHPWLGELFTQVFLRFSDKGALPFLNSMRKDIGAEEAIDEKIEETKEEVKETSSRLSESPSGPRIELNENQKERIRDSAWKRIVSGATAGAAIGKDIGGAFGSLGKAVGAGLGAILGGVGGWLFGK